MAAAAVLALALANPNRSVAAECDVDVQGGRGSGWNFSGSNSGWSDAFLQQSVGEPVLDEAFDGYTRLFVGGVQYVNSLDNPCHYSAGGADVLFPSVEVVPGIAVRPQDRLDSKRPAARELIKLKNTTGAKLTFDVEWQGTLGNNHGGEIRIGRTSSGDSEASKVDGWATTCEDLGKKGCVKQIANRAPELAHVWEGLDGKHDGLDAIQLETGNDVYALKFRNITLGPGKTTYLMRWVVLAAGIKRAGAVASELASEPAWAFAGIPNKTRKLIRNW